jgi:hypothetical protein
MTVLDTFYILFKSNGDEIEAATRRAQKITDKFGESINDSKDKAKDLGVTFTDLVAAGVAAFGSIDIAGKLKDEVSGIIDLEVQLGRLSKLTGVSASEIDAWDGAVSRASGGPAGEFVGWLTKINAELVARGQGDLTKNVIPNLLQLADAWQGLTVAQKEYQGGKFELSPDLILLLDKGPQAIRDMIAAQKELRDETDEDTKSALELKNAWDNISKAITGVVARLLLHPLDSLGKGLEALGGSDYEAEMMQKAQETEANRKRTPTGWKWFDQHIKGIDEDGNPLNGATPAPTTPASKPFTDDGGIHIDGAPPPLLPVPTTPAEALDHQSLDLNDPAVRDTLNHAVNAPKHQQIMQDAADAIQNAQTSPFASLPQAAAGNTTTVLKIDKVEIHTQATDSAGIAADFADKLHQQIGAAQANAEDGILY